jgi:hypothetical protein
VSVSIEGPVTETGTWPGEECLGGTYYQPDRGATKLAYQCTIKNVDLTHAGTYKGPEPEDAPDAYACTLEYEPR